MMKLKIDNGAFHLNGNADVRRVGELFATALNHYADNVAGELTPTRDCSATRASDFPPNHDDGAAVTIPSWAHK